MKNILENLLIDSSILSDYSSAEYYTSCNIVKQDQFIGGYKKSFNTEVYGNALRIYDNPNCGQLYTKSGSEMGELWKNFSLLNEIPHNTLPTNKVEESKLDLPVYNTQNEKLREVYDQYCKLFKEYNLQLKKMIYERHLSAYKILNTYNVYGFGYKLINGISISIINQKKEESEYSLAFCDAPLAKVIATMYKQIKQRNICETSSCEHVNIENILISKNAIFELTFVLLSFLNDQLINTGVHSLFKKLSSKDAQLFNSNISIIENSHDNKTVGGTVDGEGSERTPIYIINEGRFENPISSHIAGTKGENSASAYRFDYLSLPYSKASKVSFRQGEIDSSIILEKFDLVGVIHSFQGLFESLDPSTLNFNSAICFDIYKYGVFKGNKTLKIKSNIFKIFNSIDQVSKDCEYIGDGSIYTPSMTSKLSKIMI